MEEEFPFPETFENKMDRDKDEKKFDLGAAMRNTMIAWGCTSCAMCFTWIPKDSQYVLEVPETEIKKKAGVKEKRYFRFCNPSCRADFIYEELIDYCKRTKKPCEDCNLKHVPGYQYKQPCLSAQIAHLTNRVRDLEYRLEKANVLPPKPKPKCVNITKMSEEEKKKYCF